MSWCGGPDPGSVIASILQQWQMIRALQLQPKMLMTVAVVVPEVWTGMVQPCLCYAWEYHEHEKWKPETWDMVTHSSKLCVLTKRNQTPSLKAERSEQHQWLVQGWVQDLHRQHGNIIYIQCFLEHIIPLWAEHCKSDAGICGLMPFLHFYS